MKTRLRFNWQLEQWQLVLDAVRMQALVPITRTLLLNSMVRP